MLGYRFYKVWTLTRAKSVARLSNTRLRYDTYFRFVYSVGILGLSGLARWLCSVYHLDVSTSVQLCPRRREARTVLALL